jgi:hypothetical protein
MYPEHVCGFGEVAIGFIQDAGNEAPFELPARFRESDSLFDHFLNQALESFVHTPSVRSVRLLDRRLVRRSFSGGGSLGEGG